MEEEYGKVIRLAKVLVPDQELVSPSNVDEAVESVAVIVRLLPMTYEVEPQDASPVQVTEPVAVV